MSGSGMIARVCETRKAATERADVLALLARRRRNCETIARHEPGFADDARVQMRQIDIVADEIAAGLHEGEAEMWRESRPDTVAASDPYPFGDHASQAAVAAIDEVPTAQVAGD